MSENGASRLATAFTLSAVLALLLLLAPFSFAEVTQKQDVRVSVNGKLSPHKLPRQGRAPIAVAVSWKVATTDGTQPPTLKTLKIEINRNGILDPTGLPICPYDKIQPASTSRALKNCRASLVGRGSFAALIGLEGQESYATEGKMVVFNGEKSGKPVLLGQIYSAHPFASSFVITFVVDKLKKGTYGTSLTAKLPATLRSWGNLTEIEMRLSRKFAYKGKSRSFLSASCPAPKGFPGATFALTRTSFDFDGGLNLTSTLTRSCTVKG